MLRAGRGKEKAHPFDVDFYLTMGAVVALKRYFRVGYRGVMQAHMKALVRAYGAFERGDYEEAIWPFRMVKEGIIRDKDSAALYRLAFCEHMAGDIAEAIKIYGIAIRAGCDPFWALYHRGQALVALGKKDAAFADISWAHELDPKHEGCRNLLEELNKSRMPPDYN